MKRIIFRNLGWKLFSLALAWALWLTFVGSPEVATSVSAPVQYQNIPRDLVMIADAADRVHLEIRGPSTRLQNFDLSRTAVVLDLSEVNVPGEKTFVIGQDDVRLPAGLTLMRAVPGQIRVQFERRATRQAPVKVRFSHEPPLGYQVRQLIVEPSQVQIVGPESRVDNIEYAETDPIDLSHAVGPAQFRVNAFLPDPQVRFTSEPLVRVSVDIEKVNSVPAPAAPKKSD